MVRGQGVRKWKKVENAAIDWKKKGDTNIQVGQDWMYPNLDLNFFIFNEFR